MIPLVVEQVAHCVANVARSVDLCKLKFGAETWVRDTVSATHLYLRPDLRSSPTDFQVHLAFNYEMMPGLELELIELVSGFTAQLNPLEQRGPLSHYGFHIEDYASAQERVDPHGEERSLGAEDPLRIALQAYMDTGYSVLQVSQTVHHTGTKRRYRYAFVDARNDLGVYLKIIQRVPKMFGWADGVVAGRKEFEWLP